MLSRQKCLRVCVRLESATLSYQHGHPILTVPLPSRGDPVMFTCKPVTGTVGSLLRDIQKTDGGVHQADCFTKNGERLAKSTSFCHLLLLKEFDLELNNKKYNIKVPMEVSEKVYSPSVPADNGVNEMRYQVAKIYTALNIEAKQHEKEEELLKEKEALMKEMKPFFEANDLLVAKVEAKTKAMQYGILAYMVFQWSALARLTWWEYSWDIMEPVTYFITYGTSVALYGFYVLSKTAPNYDSYEQRLKLLYTHKIAPSMTLDIPDYNQKMRRLHVINNKLHRLRDPLRLQLPIRQIRNDATLDLY